MSVAQLAGAIGKMGYMTAKTEGLTIRIRVTDAKTAYGSERLQVTSVAGGPTCWVESWRVKLDNAEPSPRR